MGIEPTPSAWKAEVLPLNYTRLTVNQAKRHPACPAHHHHCLLKWAKFALRVVEGEGFEPSKAVPTDLQSAPFDRSGTPPK